MDCLVSIIILVYNSADSIIETLESIKVQTYRNIELVIADDCSKDNSIEVIEKWLDCNQYRFLKIKKAYGEKNIGLSGNMNRGLKAASGKYVKYLAADDVLFNRAIESYLAVAINDSNVLPICKVKLLVEENRDAEAVRKYCEKCYEISQMPQEEQYRRLLTANWVVSPAADFFNRQTLLDVGGYDERFRMIEDYPMSMKLLKKGYYFKLIDEELVGYRVSASSITGTREKELKKMRKDIFFKQTIWYMFENHMSWEAIKQLKGWLK